MDLDIDDRKPAASAASTATANDASTNGGDLSPIEMTTSVDGGTTIPPVKPVLKHQGRTSSSKSCSAKKAKQSKHLKWDEQAIEEHDQLRGTRMKIDEPNTPYTYYSDSGAESDDSRRQSSSSAQPSQQRCKSPANQKNTISWDSLQNRLDSVANVQQQQQQQYPTSPTSSFGGTDASESGDTGFAALDEHKNEMRKLEFQDHRKRHYNEFQMIQKFRQEHASADDEEDDDGDADVED